MFIGVNVVLTVNDQKDFPKSNTANMGGKHGIKLRKIIKNYNTI
jgi:hypothetical protein